MKKQYEKLKDILVTRQDYSGIVCGYKPNMIILAVEDWSRTDRTWTKLDEETFIKDDYRDDKYRYIYEDVDYILKQIGEF